MDNWSGSSANSAGIGSENLSELASGASSSDLTTTSVSSSRSTNQSDHHRYCDVFLRGNCTCDFVINLEKRHAKRQLEKSLQSSRSSHQSAILAGHLNVSSQQSSESSYHSAQSVIEPCASASNILNQDINSASELSSANEAEKALPDLNQAQNLFSHAEGDESLSEKTEKSSNLHVLLRRISDCTLGSINESETSEAIMKNLSQSYAQDPTNFTRRLVTIMEESELNNTLKRLLENYDSQIDVADTSMPTVMDDTVITPPDLILHRRGSKAVDLKTPEAPKRPTFGNYSQQPVNIIRSMRELIKSPQKKSPGIFNFVGTPSSMRSHNDSSFTALEKACGITTPDKMYSPDLREKARLEKIVAEQEKRLATESPVKNSNQATTAAASSQFIEEDSLDTDAPSDNQSSYSDEGKDTMANISQSIIEEFEKKLQRCFETHRTMCEINAESSEASASDETQSSGLVSFLNLLTHVPGYQRYLKSDEIRRAVRDRDDSGVDIRRPSSHSRRSKSRHLLKSSVDPKTLAFKVNLDCHNVTLRKPLNSSTPTSQRLPPNKLSVGSSPPSPHVNQANYSTAKKTPRPVSATIPEVLVTRPSTSNQGEKHSDLKSVNTPTEKRRVAKYFPTPDRTPMSKNRHALKNQNTPRAKNTPKFFFPPQKMATPSPSPKRTGAYEWYGLSSIKSPVAEYIHETDSTLIKNIRSKTNDRMLTPKIKSSKSMEQLNFNLAKQRTGSSPSASNRGVNDEDTPDNVNRCTIPQVRYKLPSDVRQINAESPKQSGVRTQRHMQSETERMLIRHEGRTKPETAEVVDADLSIHIIKSAEKQNFFVRHIK